MPNNSRILAGMQSLHVGPSPSTGLQPSSAIKQLHRIQDIGFDFSVTREDVSSFGQLAPLSQEITEAPTVNLNTSWLLNSVFNENSVGFVTNGLSGVLSKIINGSERDKNYFIKIAGEGNDVNNYVNATGLSAAIGIGNAAVASYSTTAQVGGFPTSSLTVQGQNIAFSTTDSGFDSPAVNPSNGVPIATTIILPHSTSGEAGMISVLRPGDIDISFSNGIGFGLGNTACIQSYNISFDLNLNPKQCIGNRLPTARNIQFPVDISLSIEAQVQDFGTGNLNTLLCEDQSNNITISLRAPSCGTGIGVTKAQFLIFGAKLQSQNYSADLSSDSTVTLNYTSKIGGPTSNSQNLYISGTLA